MAYTINKTNGSIFAQVADGATNNDSSMTIVGRNFPGYGEFIGENFIHLLENSANATEPTNPLTGQLWYDTANNRLNVYAATEFKSVTGAVSQVTQPANPASGDLWFSESLGQLFVHDGTEYILAGPLSPVAARKSGPVIVTIQDTLAVDHVVVQHWVDNILVGIESSDAAFVPDPAINGFLVLQPGYTLSTAVSGNFFTGTTTDSDRLGGEPAANYLRSNIDDSTTGTLTILNDGGLTFGANIDGQLSINGASDIFLQNKTADADIQFDVNVGGTQTTVLELNGPTGRVRVLSDFEVTTTLPQNQALFRFGESTTSNALTFTPFIQSAYHNSAVQAGDMLLRFDKGAADTGVLVIAGLGANAPSIRIDSPNKTITIADATVQIENQVVLDGLTPVGGIIMYSGTIANLPANWKVCDGANGTPNLIERFVWGTNIQGVIGAIGGSKDSVVVSHTHGITDPGHSHGISPAVSGNAAGGSNAAGGDGTSALVSATNSATTDITIDNAGNSGIGKNLPPYMYLAYIMRIS
jgi:hypothetical protein